MYYHCELLFQIAFTVLRPFWSRPVASESFFCFYLDTAGGFQYYLVRWSQESWARTVEIASQLPQVMLEVLEFL